MLGYVIYTLQLFLFLLMASHLVSHFFRTRSNINSYKYNGKFYDQIEVCNRFVGSTGSNDFYYQFFRLLQGGFRSHKRLKVLVLKNQQQRRQNPTPNQQMQHFLDFKTDTSLNS